VSTQAGIPRIESTLPTSPDSQIDSAAPAVQNKPEPLPRPTEEKNGKTLTPPRTHPGNAHPMANLGLPQPVVTHPVAAPREYAKRALSDYIIEPPDVLQIDLSPVVGDKNFPVRGTHLVRPDGTVGLGPYGGVFVAGLTIEQAKIKIADRITKSLFDEKKYFEKLREVTEGLKVDIASYNSKFFYVIADGGGYGEQVYRILCTGNETILDAIAQVEGLPRVASKKKIWIARATPTGAPYPQILPVDWAAVVQLGSAATNYQLYPGDRIYINSDPLIRADSILAKFFSPIERIFGITLLGSTTVNSIRNSNNNQSGFR
jgi:protein involved in polysaccharide export with SLBB domain